MSVHETAHTETALEKNIISFYKKKKRGFVLILQQTPLDKRENNLAKPEIAFEYKSCTLNKAAFTAFQQPSNPQDGAENSENEISLFSSGRKKSSRSKPLKLGVRIQQTEIHNRIKQIYSRSQIFMTSHLNFMTCYQSDVYNPHIENILVYKKICTIYNPPVVYTPFQEFVARQPPHTPPKKKKKSKPTFGDAKTPTPSSAFENSRCNITASDFHGRPRHFDQFYVG